MKAAELNGAHVVITDQANKPYTPTPPNHQDNLGQHQEPPGTTLTADTEFFTVTEPTGAGDARKFYRLVTVE